MRRPGLRRAASTCMRPRPGATRRPRFCVFGLLLALGSGPATAADDPLASYLVQSACIDAAGAVIPGRLPFEPGCDRRRPLAAAEPLPYRKHDWPGATDAAAQPRGYQASDSVLGTLLGRPAAIQTFDFGAPPRQFGRVDPADGGQAIPLRPGEDASIAMTEDGGGGLQWFQGPGCRPEAPDAGWLLAAPAPTAAWQQRLVRLNITPAPDACPARFNPSLTRWRTASLQLPWREAADGRTASAPAEVLVSEHYGGASIAGADHLERFWLAQGLGMVRWERWDNAAAGRRPGRAEQAEATAAALATSQRCPPIALGEAPGPGWRMVDCRTWTNFAREAPGPGLDWPPQRLR